MVHRPGDHPSEVLIRLDIPEERSLLFARFAFGVLLNERIPITTKHRVSLATAGLPIGQHTDIESLSYFLYCGRNIIVELLLRGLFREGPVDRLAGDVRRVADLYCLSLRLDKVVRRP